MALRNSSIASLITSDLVRKDETKRRGQMLDIMKERMGIKGAQERTETTTGSAEKREELAQNASTFRQRLANAGDIKRQQLVNQGAYKRATDVANISGSWGAKTQGIANKGAYKRQDLVGDQYKDRQQRELEFEERVGEKALATIPTIDASEYVYTPEEMRKKKNLGNARLTLP